VRSENAINSVIDIVQNWLAVGGAASAALSIGGRSYTLIGQCQIASNVVIAARNAADTTCSDSRQASSHITDQTARSNHDQTSRKHGPFDPDIRGRLWISPASRDQ
jgi:hypothetical protein